MKKPPQPLQKGGQSDAQLETILTDAEVQTYQKGRTTTIQSTANQCTTADLLSEPAATGIGAYPSGVLYWDRAVFSPECCFKLGDPLLSLIALLS